MNDSIIVGHNPFFGVDHLSQKRGNQKALQFEDVARIIDVLKYADSNGVKAMMMSTHPRARPLCNAIVNETSLRAWRIHPLVPYMQKYVRGANVKGMIGMLTDILGQASTGKKLQLFLRGGSGILGKNLEDVLRLLVDVELLPFKDINLGTVFLHDALTDLAVSLGAKEALELFVEHVQKSTGARAGLATKNLSLLCSVLDSTHKKNVPIMASFNGAGFYMNPSKEQCEKALRDSNVSLVAMNTLASGQLLPEAAYSYLAGFKEVKSVVVGFSREQHIDETVSAIRNNFGQRFTENNG